MLATTPSSSDAMLDHLQVASGATPESCDNCWQRRRTQPPCRKGVCAADTHCYCTLRPCILQAVSVARDVRKQAAGSSFITGAAAAEDGTCAFGTPPAAPQQQQPQQSTCDAEAPQQHRNSSNVTRQQQRSSSAEEPQTKAYRTLTARCILFDVSRSKRIYTACSHRGSLSPLLTGWCTVCNAGKMTSPLMQPALRLTPAFSKSMRSRRKFTGTSSPGLPMSAAT